MIFTKNTLYRNFCVLYCLLLPFLLQAQSSSAQIKGFVQDSIAGKPLDFVTVGLYRVSDLSKPVQNIFTSDKGTYLFTKVDTGRYVVIATHNSFAEKQSEPITIATAGDVQDMPALQLVRNSAGLQQVVVTARKPLVEQNDEKLTYNTESDPSNEGLTAVDVMRKTPMLAVDGEGNVKLNGQSNFKVLLNGKETAMFTKNLKDALQSFPANLIKKIEVITSPSSKYDGEGIGGLINIITKKKVAGYNGTLGISANTQRSQNANASASIKFGRFGFNGYYGLNNTNGRRSHSYSETESFNPVAYYKRLITNESKNNNFYNYGNVELSWEIDSLLTTSVYADVNGGSGSNTNVRNFDVVAANKADTSHSLFNSKNSYSWPAFNWGADFIKKFRNNSERELTFKMYHENSRDNSYQQADQYSASGNRFVVNDNNSRNRQSTLQLDYIQPLKDKSKLEMGVKAIVRRASADYAALVRYNVNDGFDEDPANADRFAYHQDVYSGYLNYRFIFKKISFRIGARAEHTVVRGNFIKSGTAVEQDYTTLLPSFFASRKLGNNTLSVSYNKRLQRPYIWDLNPFVNNTDSLNLYYGNPALNAELYHNAEIGYSLLKGTTSLTIKLSETFCNNQVTNWYTFNDKTGVSSRSKENLGEYYSTGLSGSLSLTVTPKLRVNSNLGLRYDVIRNKQNTAQHSNGMGGWAGANAAYDVTPRVTVFSNVNLWLPSRQLQSNGSVNMWYNAGGNYKFFNKKLVLALMMANIFSKEMVWRNTTQDENFRSRSWFYSPARMFNLSIRWNFGKLTENVSRKRGVSNDDLKAKSN